MSLIGAEIWFSGDGTSGYMHGTAEYMVEKVKIVSVHVRYFSFFSFFQFFQFRSVSVSQVTSGYTCYIRLRQFMSEGRDVELDNILDILNLDKLLLYL